MKTQEEDYLIRLADGNGGLYEQHGRADADSLLRIVEEFTGSGYDVMAAYIYRAFSDGVEDDIHVELVDGSDLVKMRRMAWAGKTN